jgi:DNA-binding beta-propeller fold protein YncE
MRLHDYWPLLAGVVPAIAVTTSLLQSAGGSPPSAALAEREVTLEGTAVVVNTNSRNVHLIDLGSGTTIAQIPAEDGPSEVAISPSGKLAAVANTGRIGNSDFGTTLTLVDIERQTGHSIDLGGHKGPTEMAWVDDDHLWVACQEPGAIVLVNVRKKSVERVYQAAPGVRSIALSPQKNLLAYADYASGTVTVVDLLSSASDLDQSKTAPAAAIVQRLKVGSTAESLVFSPDGRRLYAVDRARQLVGVYDVSTWDRTTEFYVDGLPRRVRFDGTARVVVTTPVLGGVSLVDVASGLLVRNISVDPRPEEARRQDMVAGPTDLAVLPNSIALATRRGTDTLEVLDLVTGKIKTSLPVGRGPASVAYSPLTVK